MFKHGYTSVVCAGYEFTMNNNLKKHLRVCSLLTTDTLHNLRNAERIPVSLHFLPRDRSHMRTTEIELNLGAVMAPKKRPMMLKRNSFGYIVFERRLGQYHMYVEILFVHI